MKEGELEESLISVLGNTGGHDLLQDAGELALDAVLSDGLIKDIPVVSTLVSLYKMAMGAQGYVFTRKVKGFFCELSKIPKVDRDKFANRLNSDKETASKTGEVLVCLLQRLDDLQKAAMLARAFGGYVYGDYDYLTFRRLSLAVDRCLIEDLGLLDRLKKASPLDAYIGDGLVSAGLAQVNAIPRIKFDNWQPSYLLTPLGKLFQRVVIQGKRRND